MPGGWMYPGPQQRVAVYPQPAWASSTWKLAARVESLSSAGAACTIITKQISTLTAGTSTAHPGRRRDGCTGRRGRQGPHPRARKIRSPAPVIRSRGRAALRRRSRSSARAPGERHGPRAPHALHGHMQGSTGAPGARVHGFFFFRLRWCPRPSLPLFPVIW